MARSETLKFELIWLVEASNLPHQHEEALTSYFEDRVMDGAALTLYRDHPYMNSTQQAARDFIFRQLPDNVQNVQLRFSW